MDYDFDLFVIGAGSGGVAAARRAAGYGAKVGIAESSRLGGTCVNRGCVPKKLMVYASRIPAHQEEATGYGWTLPAGTLNWETLMTAVNGETVRLNGIYERLLDNAKVEVLRGWARLTDAHTVEVGDRSVTADKILIAVGGKPVKPQSISGIELAITSDDIFHLPTQPKRVAILGGGYIGCEFACILKGLGVEVTQVIRADKILRGFDDDLRGEVQTAMQAHGIRILNNSRDIALANTDAGLEVSATIPTADGDRQAVSAIADSVCLAATGRRPNLTGLGLEHTAVKIENGAIAVEANSRTAEPNIWAVGDCTNRINLTPVAINEGRAFADTHFGNRPRQMSYDAVPSAVFTTPEIGTVGLTEAAAIAEYGDDAIQVYRSHFRPMYYVLADKDEKTLMKLVVHKDSDRVLGAHMVGDYAGEIIQGVAIAVKMGATKANFDATVGIHPTSAEEFVTMR